MNKLALSAVAIQGVLASSCPAFESVPLLDLNRYGGLWYEIARDKYTIFEIGAQCTTANYTPREDGLVTVVNRAWYPILGYKSIEGVAKQNGKGGNLTVGFNGKPLSANPNYHVIDTDYDTYSIVFNCKNIAFTHVNAFWILSRTPTLPQTPSPASCRLSPPSCQTTTRTTSTGPSKAAKQISK